MEQKQIIILAGKLKQVLSPAKLKLLSRAVGFCRRERQLNSAALVISLLSAMGCRAVETIADLQRHYNALVDDPMAYKPFHAQLAKPAFAELMRSVVAELLDELVLRVLRCHAGAVFSEFRQIIIQDGSSFAIKETLREVFPGRFKTLCPAAVELHVRLELLTEAVTRVVLTPDTFGERAELPAPEALQGCLLLADRGYLALSYLAQLLKAGASFVLRSTTNLNPLVLNAWNPEGRRVRRVAGKYLQDAMDFLPKKRPVDLDVVWKIRGQRVQFRLVVTWNKQTKEFQYLITNLPRTRYPVEHIRLAYKLRWQIELLFKEWKSYANLHAFDTSKDTLAEGLIWAAIAAATVKRFLAHATQHLCQVETSTRKVAMCASNGLGDLFKALLSGTPRAVYRAFKNVVEYLAVNAGRAHPKRDRAKGRLQLGLTPAFQDP